MKRESDNRLLELDSMRGIAAIMVVLFHYTTRYGQLYYHDTFISQLFSFGYIGVSIFFMISGFVIFHTINRVNSPAEFAYKRFSRLFPTYWFCLMLTYAAMRTFNLFNRMVSLKDAIIGLTMIQRIFGISDVDGVYWSLFVEIMFYSCIYAIFALRQKDKIDLIGVIWLILIIFDKFIYHLPYIDIILSLRYGMLFFAGILFYEVKFYDSDRKRRFFLLLCCFVTYCLVFTKIIDIIVIGLTFVVFILICYNKAFWLNNRISVGLGGISYPLYLIHQNIGYILLMRLQGIGMDYGAALSLTMIFILILAFFVNKLIERPSNSFLRSFYGRKFRKSLVTFEYHN